MYRLCRQGCAFNLLSIYGKKYFVEDENFYYADPDDIFSFCRKICPQTTIDSSYLNHDFTIFMRKV